MVSMASRKVASPTHHDHHGHATAPRASGVTDEKPTAEAAINTAVKMDAFAAVPDTVIDGSSGDVPVRQRVGSKAGFPVARWLGSRKEWLTRKEIR